MARGIRIYRQKNFKVEDLLKWIKDNNVMDTLLDPRKTHLQLVQRLGDVIQLMAVEDQLSDDDLEKIMILSRSSYKSEVYKVINDIASSLKPNHQNFFYKNLTEKKKNEFRVEDFQCLCDMGKFTIVTEFKTKLVQFFLDIIMNAENYKEDVAENAIAKFNEMIKSWDVELKFQFFDDLVQNIHDNPGKSIASVKTLEQLLTEAIDRITYNMSSSYP